MTQTFKLFMVRELLYLTIDDDVVVGDTAIVTVADQYPSVVECQNEDQIRLIQEPKLRMTKRHKVVMKPNELNLGKEVVDSFGGYDGYVVVNFEDGVISILDNEENL